MLKDANDIVSFGTLIEVQSSSGNATSEASKLSEGSGGALPSKGSVRDNWPGFLSILQAAGIYFEVPCHNDAESPSASKSTSPHASGIVSWKDAGGFVVKDDGIHRHFLYARVVSACAWSLVRELVPTTPHVSSHRPVAVRSHLLFGCRHGRGGAGP